MQRLPVKIHSDEGTGLRKTAIYQFSWGPLLSSSQASWDRYFFWGCMPREDYKKEHSGFEKGNAVLDEFCSHMARQAAHVYTEGGLAMKVICQLRLGPITCGETSIACQTTCVRGAWLTTKMFHFLMKCKKQAGDKLLGLHVHGLQQGLFLWSLGATMRRSLPMIYFTFAIWALCVVSPSICFVTWWLQHPALQLDKTFQFFVSARSPKPTCY